jgi:quercetin dioxygenase-like cupin family protein
MLIRNQEKEMKELLSHAIETVVPAIEMDLRRRLLLGGLVGSAAVFSSRGLLAQAAKPIRERITAANGVSRTILEQQELANGEEFRLVLTELPPGLSVPSHYHPVCAFSYVLEGVAESRYEDEPDVIRVAAGQSTVDKANVMHSLFRNPDPNSTLKFLVAFTIKKGEDFFKVR